MLVIYPFSLVDQELAHKNAKWIAELGEYKSHDVFILSDHRCDPEINRQVVETFTPVFRLVKHRLTKVAVDGWPEGANHMFTFSTTLIQHEKEWPYFLWLEPDAIALAPGWMDKLEDEYKRSRKPFMGDRVQVGDIPLHMSGVGIYQNPIYLLAGEAYRAHDTAWDMAAKDQIVPNAHFTNLIEHAWKHPTFHMEHELETQIAKETILFHSSKDGSLIDLLRQKAAPELETSVPTEPTIVKASREEIGTRAAQPYLGGDAIATSTGLPAMNAAPIVQTAGAAPVHDIFIRTYSGDYEWLAYSVLSIHKFCTGFRKIWVVSPGPQPSTVKGVEWKVMQDETEDGYLAQQITKLYADVLCDYQADYILHVDSDVIFTQPTTPEDFFKDGKLIWYFTPYKEIQTPWQPIMEKFMGFTMPYEFMRRLPMMIPRWLYPRLREFCHAQHGRIISEYIRTQPMRAFSEFNALGSYAYFNHPDQFAWVNTTTTQIPPPFTKQFHSWSGLTPDIKAEIEELLGGTGEKDPKDAPPVSSQIKVLPGDVWVLEGDQISQWVEQEGRLDHDQNLLPDILKHISPGDTVVDAGAFIGDHTIAYSEAVGDTGMVHAFEPNPTAYKCLCHNLETSDNVILHGYGLSDSFGTVPLSGNNGNWGGVYVGEHMKITDVRVRPLETEVPWRVNFIKIDVEGYELKVLQGAGNLIKRCHPKMVIEINQGALERQATTPDQIFGWLTQHGYDWTIIQSNALRNDPLYDILCIPRQPPEISVGPTAHTSSVAPPPVAFPLTPAGVKDYINKLREFSEESTKNKLIVSQTLRYAGLRAPGKKKKRESNPFKTTHRKRKQPA